VSVGIVQRQEASIEDLDDNLLPMCEVHMYTDSVGDWWSTVILEGEHVSVGRKVVSMITLLGKEEGNDKEGVVNR
jgi:hypothetical protein